MQNIFLSPIGVIHSTRFEPTDDAWDGVDQRIELDAERFSPDALAGLADFSHVEILYHFHRLDESKIVCGARHPRGRQDWPLVGIFAQRGRARPNRLGATVCALLRVEDLTLFVRGLDAIDGTPVIDIKPVMREFLPRGEVRQPAWSGELMKDYWA
jgi:tRNA (adenine37-N6)-methyltransferase